MRILYLSQYFPPEIGATQTRAYEMARGLVRADHQVTMICEVPNHPHGIIPAQYRGKAFERTTLNGIDVIRVWVKASPRKSFGSRMAFYLSYMAMATIAGLALARGRYDLIYASSPPLFVGAAALALSALRRLPLLFEVRDLWPESAIQLGELSNPTAARLATRLEEACYRRAQHIVAATRGIHSRLLERGLPAQKISVIPNGANTDLYQPQTPDQDLRAKLGINEEQFVVLYTGLHGLAHSLETLLEAAHRLRDEADILFLLVGDGPDKPALQRRTEELALPNLRFHDAVPEEELPAILALGHVGVDTRRRIGISRGTLPVKMFTYMACALPVILAIEGEAAELLSQAQAGFVVPPEDPDALAAAILNMRDGNEQRARMGEHGRAFVKEHYSRRNAVEKLDKILRST